jgi:hypothetical protein
MSTTKDTKYNEGNPENDFLCGHFVTFVVDGFVVR